MEWHNYVDATYGANKNITDEDNFEVIIGYGLDSFDESERENLNYSYCWTMAPQKAVFK